MCRNTLSNSLLMCMRPTFFIEIYTTNSTRKWCEKKNLAQNQRIKKNHSIFICCAEIWNLNYWLRLDDMIREHKSMTSTWFWYFDFYEMCDHYEIYRTFCVHTCVSVCVLHAPHYRTSCENWQIACFFQVLFSIR